MRDWSQLISFFIGMTVLVLWVDSRNHTEMVSMRELITAIHAETYAESKDFHGRLCTIEERYRSKK